MNRICRHCGRPTKSHRPRGLCVRCYDDLDIRLRYEPLTAAGKHAAAEYGRHSGDMSETEFEALIAQQYANLPEWWEKETQEEIDS